MTTKTELMKQIRDEIIDLKESPLYEYRTQNNFVPVIGEGSHDANIFFIGEAPGKNEAMTGRPFCGASGKVLDQMLESIGLDRKGVYVSNIVKDRPPDNRDPTPKEIALYSPFLKRQIEIIKPAVIATLGRFSMTYILTLFDFKEKDQPIGKMHGKVLEGKADYGKIHVVPLYHPAVALYNGGTRTILKEDFQVLKQFI
jgi:DNA polymerase